MSVLRHGKLTKSERRTILALLAEQKRIQEEVNETNNAISDAIVSIAERQKLPPDKYMLSVDGDEMVLIREAPEEAATAKPEEASAEAPE